MKELVSPMDGKRDVYSLFLSTPLLPQHSKTVAARAKHPAFRPLKMFPSSFQMSEHLSQV